MNKYDMTRDQFTRYMEHVNTVNSEYIKLIEKRNNNELTRDELFIYELLDMFIPLSSITTEINSEYIDNEYISEKLNSISRLLNAAINHFEE